MKSSGEAFHSPAGEPPSARSTLMDRALSPRERSAVRSFVWRVLDEVPADLVEAALFGSRARGMSRPDSDIDVLLVFAALPPDREPHAGIAERIALEVARSSGVPVTVWSVSLDDTLIGNRTPMLVDALADAIPIWCWPQPLPPVSFTPHDAVRCCDALLERVHEGSAQFARSMLESDPASAARRARDDLVRLCTALLLLQGVTRPRRGEAIRALLQTGALGDVPTRIRRTLEWGALSFGPEGDDEAAVVSPPPDGLEPVARAIDFLLRAVSDGVAEMAASLPAAIPAGPG